MSIRNARPLREADEDGSEEAVLCVVKYVGARSIYNNDALRNQGGYPGYTAFNRGDAVVTYLPDSRLGWWEGHEDFEVAYDEEALAKALLDMNSLPDSAFGPGYDSQTREDVFEKLDLEPSMDDEGYYEQLADIAGLDEEEAEEVATPKADTDRRDELMEYTRGDLMQVTSEYDHEFDSISSATKSDLAEFLKEKDDDEVDSLLDKAEKGEL